VSRPPRFRINPIDHTLRLTLTGDDGREADSVLTLDDITRMMAVLSQSQYIIGLQRAGHKVDPTKFDPNSAFDSVSSGFAFGRFDEIRRLSVGIDPTLGEVIFSFLGVSGILTGCRMSPDTAKTVAEALQGRADDIQSAQTSSQH
jgi:hypothetical protein